MIDTLMVVWTSGLWKQFLRSTCTFLLLFGCICILSFLITTSGNKWSGLAVSVPQASPAQPSAAQPAPAPTAHPTSIPYIVPIILQNPVLPNSADAGQDTQSAQNTQDTRNAQNTQRHSRRHYYAPPAYTQPEQQPTPVPTRSPGSDTFDPENPLQNLP